jgi:hypothetical protein
MPQLRRRQVLGKMESQHRQQTQKAQRQGDDGGDDPLAGIQPAIALQQARGLLDDGTDDFHGSPRDEQAVVDQNTARRSGHNGSAQHTEGAIRVLLLIEVVRAAERSRREVSP